MHGCIRLHAHVAEIGKAGHVHPGLKHQLRQLLCKAGDKKSRSQAVQRGEVHRRVSAQVVRSRQRNDGVTGLTQ